MLDRLSENIHVPFNSEAIMRGGAPLAEYMRTLVSVLQSDGHYEERKTINWILGIQNAGVVYFAAPDGNGVYPTNTMRLYWSANVLYLQAFNGSTWTTITSTTQAGLFSTADIALSSPSQIYLLNHDSFAGFVANEHVDHSAVSINTTAPLSGGGDLTATRTLALLLLAADLAVNGTNQLYVVDSGINHDATANFVANEHIDHTAVSISAGGILTGGGAIDANRTISLAHSGVDHDQTTNFAADEHVAHSGVSISTTAPLSGGGTIAATRTLALAVDANDLGVDGFNQLYVKDGGIAHGGLSGAHNLTTDIDHDALTNFAADEHVSHTGSKSGTVSFNDGDAIAHVVTIGAGGIITSWTKGGIEQLV